MDQEFTGRELPFDRVMTRGELLEILSDPVRLADLQEKAKTTELGIDSHTFQPYKVIDGARYDLEVMMDESVIDEMDKRFSGL